MIARRALLATALAAPAIARGQSRPLRFVPAADVTVLDPLGTTAYPTRNHGHMCWDTLYGVDTDLRPWPQLAEGHTVEDDGRRWVFTLRDGPTFHDGEKIRAADAVASIRRWLPRDSYGQVLAARLDALTVLDDRRFEMRLSRRFGPMLDALGKATSYPCFVYPERFAAVDPAKPFTEVVGSGPYRFVASERVSGAQLVYQRFDRYIPTPVGPQSLSAGPKLAHFERVEWRIIPDPATSAAGLQAGEIDWWEEVTPDLNPLLARAPGIVLDQVNTSGTYAALRFNHLYPPFDDPAARRAVMLGASQADFMTAVAGTDPRQWRDDVGCFPVASPLANPAGMAAVTGPRDLSGARAWKGAKVIALHATDIANQNALSAVGFDLLQRMGFDAVDTTMDWGTLLQRRTRPQPPAEGGWHVFTAQFSGAELNTPGGNVMLRANGRDAWFGWPTSVALEDLRTRWFDAPDLDAQKALAAKLQTEFFAVMPYVPLGQYFGQSAYRKGLTGVRRGIVLPIDVREA